MGSDCAAGRLDSKVKLHFKISKASHIAIPKLAVRIANEDQILKKIFGYLDPEDVAACKLACWAWWDICQLEFEPEEISAFEPLSRRVEILDGIFSFISNKADRCTCRLISWGFNNVSKHRLSFSPILTDMTRNGILKMDHQTRIKELKVEDLYSPLPTDENGIVLSSLKHENIRMLSFFEGVSTYNKNVLVLSFPRIVKLKYIWATTFVLPEKDQFDYLTSLQIRGMAHASNGNLEEFFSQAKFPNLTDINIELHFRRDLSLYMQSHRFIGNHHVTLRNLELEFKSYCYPESIRENAGSMLILLSNELIEKYNEIVELLKKTELESLKITFLDFEGTSMFHLGFTLLLAQKRLRTLCIIKEYTKTRREFLPLYVCLKKNEKTLENLSIPHPYSFNCSALSQCHLLRSISVGRMWGPRFMDSKAYFVEMLPTHPELKKLRMSIKLSFIQIYWIVHHLDLTDFEFRGSPGEPFTLSMIQMILKKQSSLARLEFDGEMSLQEFKVIKIFFTWTRGIRMEWAHCDTSSEPSAGDNATHRGEFQLSINRADFNLKT